MAILYPFDETLKGHLEIVDIDPTILTLPMFIFPKGSFFVDGTYIKIKNTDTILRPGIDYGVLSCNERIPFSFDPALNEKIKTAYTRNVILLKKAFTQTLECYVAYCGGEEHTQAAEYQNYINTLYSEALFNGTASEFKTPNQGWGNYLDSANKQITSGQHIYARDTLKELEIEEGGALGWSNVELALSSLADTVESGGDPLIMQAFYNWIGHHEIEVNKKLNAMKIDLDNKISKLDGLRVGINQYIYASVPNTPPKHRYLEHKNIVLRGSDPANGESLMDIHSFAARGETTNLQATHLLQRMANNFDNPRGTLHASIKMSDGVYTCTLKTLQMPAYPTGWVLKVISATMGTILEHPFAPGAPVSISRSYIPPNSPVLVDTLFAIAVNTELGFFSDFSGTDLIMVDVQESDDYTIEILNNNSVIVGDSIHNDIGTHNQFNVRIHRKVTSTVEKTVQLTLISGNGVEFEDHQVDVVFSPDATSVLVTGFVLTLHDMPSDAIYLAVRDTGRLSARTPIVVNWNDLNTMVVGLIQANSNGTPYSKGEYLLVQPSRELIGTERLSAFVKNLYVKFDEEPAKLLPIDGLTTSPSNGNHYLIPLNFTDRNIGDVAQIYSDLIPSLKLNIVIVDVGFRELEDVDPNELVIKVTGVVKSQDSNFYSEIHIGTKEQYGTITVMVDGFKHQVRLAPYVSTSIRVSKTINRAEQDIEIIIGEWRRVITPDLTSSNFYLESINGDYFPTQAASVLNYSNTPVRLSYINFDDVPVNVLANGPIKAVTVAAKSMAVISDFFVLPDLKIDNIVIDTLTNGLPMKYTIPTEFINDDNRLVIANKQTGRNTFRMFETNRFTAWVGVGNVTKASIKSVNFMGRDLGTDAVTITNGVLAIDFEIVPTAIFEGIQFSGVLVLGVLSVVDINNVTKTYYGFLNRVL